jgi:hypothetical protein
MLTGCRAYTWSHSSGVRDLGSTRGLICSRTHDGTAQMTVWFERCGIGMREKPITCLLQPATLYATVI